MADHQKDVMGSWHLGHTASSGSQAPLTELFYISVPKVSVKHSVSLYSYTNSLFFRFIPYSSCSSKKIIRTPEKFTTWHRV